MAHKASDEKDPEPTKSSVARWIEFRIEDEPVVQLLKTAPDRVVVKWIKPSPVWSPTELEALADFLMAHSSGV